MQRLTRHEIQGLVRHRVGPCLSLYVPPGDRDARRACFAALTREAHGLLARTYPAAFAAQVTAELQADVAALPDTDPRQALAVFHSRHVHGWYGHEEPWPALAVVADSFHVKPLLPVLQAAETFFLLHATPASVRFWVVEPDLTRLAFEDFEPDLGVTAPPASRSREAGGGVAPKLGLDDKRNLVRYFRGLDIRLRPHWEEGHVPLVLAGEPWLLEHFRMVTKHRFVSAESVAPALTDTTAVLDAARSISARLRGLETRQAAELFRRLRPRGMATDELPAILSAAARGRVRALLLDKEAQLWGTVNVKTGRIETHPRQYDAHDGDIYEALAERVLEKGGRVFVLDRALPMPTHAPIAAILR